MISGNALVGEKLGGGAQPVELCRAWGGGGTGPSVCEEPRTAGDVHAGLSGDCKLESISHKLGTI